PAAYNQVRFGSPLEFGIRYELSDWDIRTIRLFSPSYLPFNLAGNLFGGPRTAPAFPFFGALPALPVPPPAGYMMMETRVGLVACMPLAALVVAWPLLLRDPAPARALALGATLGLTGLVIALAVSTFAASSVRFLLDFCLPVLVSAGLAWVRLDQALDERRAARLAVRAACALAVAYGATVNLAL